VSERCSLVFILVVVIVAVAVIVVVRKLILRDGLNARTDIQSTTCGAAPESLAIDESSSSSKSLSQSAASPI
jgi:hypothetical protein